MGAETDGHRLQYCVANRYSEFRIFNCFCSLCFLSDLTVVGAVVGAGLSDTVEFRWLKSAVLSDSHNSHSEQASRLGQLSCEL
jgi:hypothetical protein